MEPMSGLAYSYGRMMDSSSEMDVGLTYSMGEFAGVNSVNFFPEQNQYFSIDPPTTPPPPRMLVTPLKTLNFTNVYVQFNVTLINCPTEVNVAKLHLEAKAQSPTGKMVECSFTRSERNPPFSPLDTFKGSFKSTDEVGMYRVEVRLALPTVVLAKYPSFDPILCDTAYCLVSRNFLKEAKKLGDIRFETGNLSGSSSPGSIQGSPDSGESFESRYSKQPQPTVSKAWGLACDRPTNRIFYADRASHRVFCMDPAEGIELFSIDKASRDCLNRPTGIAVDEFNRRLIITDKDNHRICIYSLDGHFITSFGKPGHQNGEFNYPWDIAVSPDGSLIVTADSRNKRLQIFDREGHYVGKYSVYETKPFEHKSMLDYPRGVTFGIDATVIYTTDFNVQNVLKIPISLDRHEKVMQDSLHHGSLRRPQGITVDSVGSILICDSRNNFIRHVGMDGKVVSNIKEIGNQVVRYPVNIAMLQQDKVAVLDGEGKVHIF